MASQFPWTDNNSFSKNALPVVDDQDCPETGREVPVPRSTKNQGRPTIIHLLCVPPPKQGECCIRTTEGFADVSHLLGKGVPRPTGLPVG